MGTYESQHPSSSFAKKESQYGFVVAAAVIVTLSDDEIVHAFMSSAAESHLVFPQKMTLG